jgi:hypothetical protein
MPAAMHREAALHCVRRTETDFMQALMSLTSGAYNDS